MSMAAGWYPDPFSSAGYLRWWDGTQWTSQTSLQTMVGSPPPVDYRYPGGATATYPLASWGARFGAWLIDIAIVTVVTAPIYLVALWPAFTDLFAAVPRDGSEVPVNVIVDFQAKVLGTSLLLSAISAVIMFVYMVPQNVKYGRTVGKRVVGIRIRMLEQDRNPGWREATVRWAVFTVGSMFAGGIFLLIDCLWPLWDKPWQQALHDKAAKTVVVPR